jgi:hypothetical protein
MFDREVTTPPPPPSEIHVFLPAFRSHHLLPLLLLLHSPHSSLRTAKRKEKGPNEPGNPQLSKTEQREGKDEMR